MWPKIFVTAGIAIALPLMVAAPGRAELASGSVLNIASQGMGIVPDRKVMIELEADNRLVFRSGHTGRLLPTANQGSQLTLGLGTDRQINILPSSVTFATAYADTRTIVQDLPLNSLGVFQGEIPGFIQNIWVKTAGGGREVVSFTLFSVNYNEQTGQGELTGAFIEANGKERLANGSFNLDPRDGCACNYTMQLAVQALAGGPGGPGGPGGGSAVGTPPPPIGATPPGGGGSAFPLLALAALPFFSNDHSNHQESPGNQPPGNSTPPGNQPSGNQPPGNSTPPGNQPPHSDQPPSAPTPALLPGLIGMFWKTWRRKRALASLPNRPPAPNAGGA
jgi:hypothetical protein